MRLLPRRPVPDAVPASAGMTAARQARLPVLGEALFRRTTIRLRILAIALANSALAVMLLLLIWNNAQVLRSAWTDLSRVQQSERFLMQLGQDAERLQSLIHRYFAQSEAVILAKIVDLRELLVSRLRVQARLDPLIAAQTRDLRELTERFVAGFDDLRETRTGISLAYDSKISKPSREMASFYAALSAATADRTSPVWPALVSLRESYNAMILATNAFYLAGTDTAAREAKAHAAAITGAVPGLLAMVEDRARRGALNELLWRAETIEEGVGDLEVWFATQGRLLRDAIDGNAEAMSGAIDRMRVGIQDIERSAQARFDRTLDDVAIKLALMSVAFVLLVALAGLLIARSIAGPLADLRQSMTAITAGDLDHPVPGLAAVDEIGQMARATDTFRRDAIAKKAAEDELRASKESAEAALAELRSAQASLIEAEKLAALGGLVAGVAHEVNNPVGISLTVASTLAARAETFAEASAAGPIRRSQLDSFTKSTVLAAGQLVANLQRAGELIQSFKQVAVDRSQADRRAFDLADAIGQILASLRPSLKGSRIGLDVDVPADITMDGFPGPFGQVLTNLFLNAVHHGFAEGRGGTISIRARRRGRAEVEIVFRDDGHGMSEDVQRRAFDPFFTTRRTAGGTGLGLHIVYNIVTNRLGGRVALASTIGHGSTFTLVLPLRAPDGPATGAPPLPDTEQLHV